MPKAITKLSRFKELDSRIKKNLVQAGEDLQEIRDGELYKEDGHKDFKSYCESLGKNYHWGWRQIEAGKIAKTLPSVNVPNEATARELKKVALPQRRQVASAAMESTGGKLSAPAIKNAANSLPQRKNSPKDGTGLPIPPELEQFWGRNEEVQHLLGMVSKIRTTLEKSQETKDKLFSMIDIQGSVDRLTMVYQEIASAKSFAVCPTCNGVDFDKCEHCKGRGTLSKFHWDFVPQEIQDLRK